LITWHIKSTYVINLCHVKDILTLMMPFLINPTVPTSITADRPVSDLRVIGPIFGLVMPCRDRSPNIKYAAITRSLCWKYALEAIINWLLLYFLVHDNRLLSMLELY